MDWGEVITNTTKHFYCSTQVNYLNTAAAGLMAEFGQEAQSRVLVRRALQEDAADTLECLVDKWIKYFRATFHRNTGYAVQFFFCKLSELSIKFFYLTLYSGELLNFVLLWVQFAETDKFLNGKLIVFKRCGRNY